jgi:hypothetical protein
MQHKLTKGPLLNDQGELIEAGYHTSLVKNYDRKEIKVKGMRTKEWDYYYVGNEQIGFALTVADNDYLWLTSITFFDFIEKKEHTYTKLGWFPRGKFKMPSTSVKGDIRLKSSKQTIEIILEGKKRHLKVYVKDFKKGIDLNANLILEPTIKDSMVIATPFNKKGHFYYNQKINLLKSKGSLILGHHAFELNDGYGVLDWGRGVWTYQNTWYWSSLSGVEEGHLIGFNLGYGFGDTSKASENMVFYDQETFKLEDVTFNIPMKEGKESYLEPWTITSSKEDISLTFTPILDRHSHSNIIFISSLQHQVFGKFSGTIKVSGDRVIQIKNLMGFAEKVKNRW